jgi:hypothetical protein
MTDKELHILQRYFPEAAIPMVAEAYSRARFNLRFNLRFKRPRTSKLGDFRAPRNSDELCTITLNQDLNPYQMLVTFVHELAHYQVHVNYQKKRLEPHGEEWKQTFTQLLLPYLKPEIFPEDIIQALHHHLQHIKASSTADQHLAKVMKRYDKNVSGEKTLTVEELPDGTIFQLKNGMTFKKGPKRRTRYQCECMDNGETYTVSGMAEVKK